MLYIILIFIIIYLLIYIYKSNHKIKIISEQVNQVLFEQKDIYIQNYQEGSLSILESEIVKLVNRLYEKNQLLYEEKKLLKQSLEDISHQIKTPLTSLNLIQERLKKSNDKEKNQLIKEQQYLLDKIEWLISSLLKMAQIDANTVIFQKENINQKDFINQLIKPFEIQLELKNIHLQIQTENQILKNIDKKWLEEALANIFKNCIEHTSYDGKISIIINKNPLYQEIIIEDNGESISKEDLPHLFERFYKGKNATQHSVGIGLALSKMIIEKQNGTITVENIYPGVRFTIHLYDNFVI